MWLTFQPACCCCCHPIAAKCPVKNQIHISLMTLDIHQTAVMVSKQKHMHKLPPVPSYPTMTLVNEQLCGWFSLANVTWAAAAWAKLSDNRRLSNDTQWTLSGPLGGSYAQWLSKGDLSIILFCSSDCLSLCLGDFTFSLVKHRNGFTVIFLERCLLSISHQL